ncbi:MAG: trypsin-like peptidase domain-containing protein [Planctomycetota bacterium]
MSIHSPHPYSTPTGEEAIAWSAFIQKDGATFVRIHFSSNTQLDEDGMDTIVVRDQNGEIVARYDSDQLANRWTPTLQGEGITVELISAEGTGGYGVEIDQVVWGTEPLMEPLPVTAGGGIVSICDTTVPARIRTADPVARITWIDDCGGAFTCTGWLFSPLGHFMTNAHCANTQVEANTMEAWFNYMNSSCDLPGHPNPDIYDDAITFQRMNCDLDYSVFIIRDPTKGNPADVYGSFHISLSTPVNGTELWIPQHPGGSPRQISENCTVTDNSEPGFNGCSDPSNGCPEQGFFVGQADMSFTCGIAPGSSGSPVLNLSDQVVAIAHAASMTENFGVRMGPIAADIPNQPVLLTINGPANVHELETAQYTAVVSYLLTPDRAVTNFAQWSIGSATAGTISNMGLFSAAMVANDRTITISASYTEGSTTVTDSHRITIENVPSSISILGSIPPDDAIDARQTSDLGGSNPQGWNTVDLDFSGDVAELTVNSFSISRQGGVLTPTLVSVVPLDGDSVRLTLVDPLEPGTWTKFNHLMSGTSVRLGFLPGDVNTDGTSNSNDTLHLLNALQGIGSPLDPWSFDANTDGVLSIFDLPRQLDLLNGADEFDVWNGVSLPQ